MSSFKTFIHGLVPPFAWRISREILVPINKKIVGQQPNGDQLLKQKKETVRGIFMHIHKCAGSSMIDAFASNPSIISCIARPGVFPGRTGRELIPNELFEKCMKFTFVRNPYARLVSAYKMFSSSLIWKNHFNSFDEFIEFIQWTRVDSHFVERQIPINDFQRSIPDLIQHCSSYHNPKYMLDKMDFIGRLENLEHDLLKIAELLDIEPFSIPHLNKHTRSYNYRNYYNSNSQRKVFHLYQKDIERFGYEF